MIAPEVVEAFVSNTTEKTSPSIPFENLDISGLENCNSKRGDIDVDFLCYTNKSQNLFSNSDSNSRSSEKFQNDSRTALEKIIGNPMVKFLRQCYNERIHSSYLDSVFVFAEVGDMRIGRPLFSHISRDEETDPEDEDCEHVSFNMSNDNVMNDLNQILTTLPNGSIPFDDFKKVILEKFYNERLTVFCFGQKTPLALWAVFLHDLADSDGDLDIALGYEYSTPNYFVSTAFVSELSKFQFSNWLSNISTNTLVTDPEWCGRKVAYSYRICAYNTSSMTKSTLILSSRKDKQVMRTTVH